MKNIFILALITLASFPSFGQIKFDNLTWFEAKAKAKAEKKKIFVYLTNPACDSCERIKTQVSQLKGVDSTIQASYISVNYDEHAFLQTYTGPINKLKVDTLRQYPLGLVFDYNDHLLLINRINSWGAFLGLFYHAQNPVLANSLYISYKRMIKDNQNPARKDSLMSWLKEYLCYQYSFYAKSEIINFEGDTLKIDGTTLADSLLTEVTELGVNCDSYIVLYYLNPAYNSTSYHFVVKNFEQFSSCFYPKVFAEQKGPFYERMLNKAILFPEKSITKTELEQKYNFCKKLLDRIDTGKYPTIEASFYNYFIEAYFKLGDKKRLREVSSAYADRLVAIDTSLFKTFIKKEPVLLTKNSEKYDLFTRFFPLSMQSGRMNFFYYQRILTPARVILYYFCDGSLIFKKNLEDFSSILNNVAWYHYKTFKQTKYLSNALNWIIRSKQLGETYQNNDTYARLLYRLHHPSDAIKSMEYAIDLAKEKSNKGDYQNMLITLDLMKRGKSIE